MIGALSETIVASGFKWGENEKRSCSLLPNPWRRNTNGDLLVLFFGFLIK